MRIEQLIQFHEYLSSGNLTVASQKLFMTPQALHVSMKRLEEELGVKLIKKGSFGIETTDAGKLFLDFSNNVISCYNTFINDLEIAKIKKKQLSGKLYIYSNMLFWRNILPEVIKKFSDAYPNVQLHIFENDTTKIYKEFNESFSDNTSGRIGFLHIPLTRKKIKNNWYNSKNYKFYELRKGFFYACTNKIFDLESVVSIKKIIQYPIVLYATSTTTLFYKQNDIMNPILLLLSEFGDVNIAYSVNTMDFWKQTILNKKCIGFIHSSLVEQNDPIINDLKLIQIKENLCSTLGCIHPVEKNELENTFLRYVERYFYTSDRT